MAASPANIQILLRENAGRFSVERSSRIRAAELRGCRSTQFRQYRDSSSAIKGETRTTKTVLWRTEVSEAYARPRMSSGSTIFFWDKNSPHRAKPASRNARKHNC